MRVHSTQARIQKHKTPYYQVIIIIVIIVSQSMSWICNLEISKILDKQTQGRDLTLLHSIITGEPKMQRKHVIRVALDFK